jgi:hypothetical protein
VRSSEGEGKVMRLTHRGRVAVWLLCVGFVVFIAWVPPGWWL